MNQFMKLLSTIVLVLGCLNFTQAQMLWPGDVDNNGEVDHVDLLYLGIAHGATGPPRTTPSTNWQAQSFTSWGITFPDTGLDYAYADCNGDGVIDELDADVIIFDNYGEIHGVVTPTVFPSGVPGINPQLFFDTTTTTQIFTNVVFLPISLGSASLPATDFYGLSFTIEYNPAVFNFSQFDVDDFGSPDPTWIQASGPILHTSSFDEMDPSTGRLEVTIVKQDGIPIMEGEGIIGTFFGIIEENVVALLSGGGISLETFLEIKDIRFVNENLENIPIVEDTTGIILVEIDTNLLSTTDLLSDEVILYPNPAKDQIFIQTPEMNVEQLIIVNQSGKVIYRKEDFINEETIEISITNIPSGFYFVKLLTDRGLAVKKISIQR